MNKKIIGITGGIGAGKSVVSQMLRCIGFKVYDCDSNAKLLMDNSDYIKQQICRQISPQAVVNGTINRVLLGKIVFNDKTSLEKLNAITHKAVKENIKNWISANENEHLLFIESAILYQSRLDKLVDEVWNIEAPEDLRILRVIQRNNITREEVVNRIESQNEELSMPEIRPKINKIVNDGTSALLPQVLTLL